MLNLDGIAKQRVGQPSLANLVFDAPPAISGITPSVGALSGGTAIQITGMGFRSGAKLFLNGIALPTVFVSGTTLSATTPASAISGPVIGRVVNPDGISAELANAFRYDEAAPPRVERLEPARGVPGQPSEVAILGAGFAEGCAVFVAGQAQGVRFVSPERLDVTLPAREQPSRIDVEVRNPDGQSYLSRNAFELRGPPRLDSSDPREGSRAGDQVVTLVGSGFDLGCSVSIGGFTAKCEWQSEIRLRAVVPANLEAETVDVIVTNPDGQSALLPRAFTYAARVTPEVARLAPTSGPTTGNVAVLVAGTHLDLVSQVLVDGVPAPSFKAKSAEELAFLTPARRSEGVVDVEFCTRDSGRILRKNAFQYKAVPPPVIRSISPNRGAVSGGTEVTISGDHFPAGSSVLVDGVPAAAAKVRNASTIEFAAPPGASGRMVDIVVRSPTGQEVLMKRAFLYDPRYR